MTIIHTIIGKNCPKCKGPMVKTTLNGDIICYNLCDRGGDGKGWSFHPTYQTWEEVSDYREILRAFQRGIDLPSNWP